MVQTSAILFAAATIFSSASAHMKMVQPPPYGPETLNNSPLAADGSDFPCKNRPGAFAPPQSTATMPIGAKQTLQLQGGATHGGGSCQISLTKDMQPTKDSQFMVIHSIEGGCPTSSAGNIGDDANALDPTTFEYSIPDGIAPGNYALAWTWFNKIGNREMYMNCAPVTVTGGSKKRAEDVEETGFNETIGSYNPLEQRDASFPPMFTANIPATDCTTTESTDVQFPNPGQSVVKNSQVLKPPTGPKCGQSNAASGGSSASAAAPAPSGAAPAPSGAAPAAPPPAGGSPGTATILASPAPAAPAPSAAAPAPAPAAPAASGSSSGAGAAAPAAAPASGSSGCTAGQMMCSADGTQFGLCNNGAVTYQPVAAGTKCVNGQIGFAKRSAKFVKL